MPKFTHGNCLKLNVHSDMLLFDRIYVGMGVFEEHQDFFKSLIKINGILIMPLEDNVCFGFYKSGLIVYFIFS